MTTIIDTSEKLKAFVVTAFNTVIVEHDAATPSNEPIVNVALNGLFLNIGSTLDVQDHGRLTIGGSLNTSVLGAINIGDNGTVVLHALLTSQFLSKITFTGHDATARLNISETKLNFLPSIGGFGQNDLIQLQGVDATSAKWVPGWFGQGSLLLYNGATFEKSIGLTGNYTSADFGLTVLPSTGAPGFTTIISYVPPEGAGFSLPNSAAAQHGEPTSHGGLHTPPEAQHDMLPINHHSWA